jgi:hypothetical protein
MYTLVEDSNNKEISAIIYKTPCGQSFPVAAVYFGETLEDTLLELVDVKVAANSLVNIVALIKDHFAVSD